MSEVSPNINAEKSNLKTVETNHLSQDDVGQQKGARAATLADDTAKVADADIPTKKRKTRRGKSKRKQPYLKYGRKYNKMGKTKMYKPEAPHNDNQFLLEDHFMIEDLDERLKCEEAASTSTLTRTRDSSFSVDSCDEFYSSPDDEEQFLLKDFDDQYERVQTEKLFTMSKQELVQEYLALDNRYQELIAQKPKEKQLEETITKLQKELEKCRSEKENLQDENEVLKSKLEQNRTCKSDSEDSETDSSDSCSTSSSHSSSSCSSQAASPKLINATLNIRKSNGHGSPSPSSLGPVST
ncbi:protein HEXIM1 [Cylas formicarius]|uniref:protein HEXIM1 n=1 Tax=Cylas formicarius TaxID=197179 RepID=UPI0029585029|nr:protein HEXIM1 [Cylas formicarius]